MSTLKIQNQKNSTKSSNLTLDYLQSSATIERFVSHEKNQCPCQCFKIKLSIYSLDSTTHVVQNDFSFRIHTGNMLQKINRNFWKSEAQASKQVIILQIRNKYKHTIYSPPIMYKNQFFYKFIPDRKRKYITISFKLIKNALLTVWYLPQIYKTQQVELSIQNQQSLFSKKDLPPAKTKKLFSLL